MWRVLPRMLAYRIDIRPFRSWISFVRDPDSDALLDGARDAWGVEDYRAIWAIVVVKDEATHVRFSGPSKIVAKHFDEFEKWLKALK